MLTTRTPIGRRVGPKLAFKAAPLVRVRPKELAAAGVERVPRVAGVRDGLPLLEDGRVLEVSNVIWCTGFREDFGWIDLPIFDADGRPRHDRGVVTSEPGLYFMGLVFQYAVSSDVLPGVGRHAEHIAKHIASRRPSSERTAAVGRMRTGDVAAEELLDVDLPRRRRVLAVDRANGMRLPFGDGSFDVVRCRQALQLFPDRGRALAEMRRVLVPGGRVAVSVWGPIEGSPAHAALADSLERHAGVRVAAGVRWLFSLPEPADLRALLAGAGFDRIRLRTSRTTTRFRSVREFLGSDLPGSMLGPACALVSEDLGSAVLADLQARLAPRVAGRGLTVAMEANTATGSRP